jgi:ribosomal protein S12 methylthiotransferase
MRASVGFVSLGCPKNLVDTERMMDLLSKDGAILTGDQNSADIVVVNTCGFLEPAKKESLDTIGEFVQLKTAGKVRGVVVTGCMTERYLDVMREKYPSVDAFLQTKDFSKIVEVVRNIQTGDYQALEARKLLVGEQLVGNSELTDFVSRAAGRRSFAYVKIAEGCNRTCSFCIIPKLRGKLHSRSIAGIVDEVKQLVAHGTREIILIAQDLTSYGRDRDANLLELLKEIDEVEGLGWFRLMYNYPRFFTDELIDFLGSAKRFCGYLDIPFQHSSDAVLKGMRRPEGAAEIKALISKLRAAIPDLSLRTTLMVGFPGETESDFESLLEFVKFAKFDNVGAFTFYREAGTPSYDLPNQISDEVKQQRYAELMALQKQVQKKILKSRIGQTLPVIIDGFSELTKNGRIYRGRHYGQAPDIDGMTYVLSEADLVIGEIYPVELAKIVGDYDLLGVPAEANVDEIRFEQSKRTSDQA